LAAFQALAGLAIGPFLFLGANYHPVVALCAASWFVLAAIAWLLAERLPVASFEASLYASSAVVGLHSAFTPQPPMQVLDGLELLVLGMFAAFALQPRRLTAWLSLSSVCYLAGLLFNPLPGGIWLGPVILIMVVGTTTVVRRLVAQIRAASRRDPLTGALNRLGLAEESALLAGIAARTQTPITIVFLDLDRFKAYNDTAGHAAGDQLLVDLVQTLHTHLRSTDLVARVGGDEFVLVLLGVTAADSEVVTSRLREVTPISCSYGVREWLPGTDLAETIDAADRRMYEQKISEPR
jgi:diguanylate cyclase (GGDEF)-like protein